MAPDRLFRGAIAIERGGVDPVDAGLDRAGERSDPRRLVALDQDSASIAATKRELGDLKARAAQQVLSHRVKLSRPRRLRTQLETLNLAGRGLRQVDSKLDPARILVGRELG